MVAAIIEMATTLTAKPTPDRIIVLHSHATTKCNARTVDWFRGTSYRGIDLWWVLRAFTGRSSVTLHRCDKETRVLKMRLGWSVLGVLLGGAHMHSEHAN
jgi:hypothetical protein